MALGKPSTKTLAENLRAELRAAYQRVKRTRDRDAIYEYLTLVYQRYKEIPASKRNAIARFLAGVPDPTEVLPFDNLFYILRATAAPVTPQAINKWKKCLARARHDKVQPSKLKEVIKAAGGVNKYLAKAHLKANSKQMPIAATKAVAKVAGEPRSVTPNRTVLVKVAQKR
jgi:hypothetical protein